MVWRVVGGSVAAWLCSLCCGWLVLGARLSPRPRLSSLQVPGLRPPVARCRPAHPRIGGTVHCGNAHGHLAPSDTLCHFGGNGQERPNSQMHCPSFPDFPLTAFHISIFIKKSAASKMFENSSHNLAKRDPNRLRGQKKFYS